MMDVLLAPVAASGDLSRVDGAELLRLLEAATAERRRIDARIARISGEIDRRSSYELGYDGLAQRAGARNAAGLVQRITGATKQEASSLVRVGRMFADETPWLAGVAARVDDGSLSVAAAAAIGSGLGTPSDDIAADDLADAATAIGSSSRGVAPEDLGAAARSARDDLDAAGIADRERVLRDRRYLRLIPQGDGTTRITGLLDPESAALVSSAIDLATSPRRGGPRFVSDVDRPRAAEVETDPRTHEQLAVDTLTELVRIGSSAEPGRLYGSRTPGVRVHVTQADLVTDGPAFIEGQTASVSTATAERVACATGYLPILFDGAGAVMNHGRARRLFDENQRNVLAAIWGGCAVDGCDRPPSWTEAHHIDEWERHHGRTDVGRGVLLCKHHHLLLHNNHWAIAESSDGSMMMNPPPGDRVARPMALRKKNPAWNRDRRQRPVTGRLAPPSAESTPRQLALAK